jgi:hypothetical protein
MISKTDNSNSYFRSVGGLKSEQELTNAEVKSEKTETTKPGFTEQDSFVDQKTAPDFKTPSQIEYPNLVSEKKK